MGYYSLADELFYGGAAGGGKALYNKSMIPTPSGWKTIAELVPGDQVFGSNGCPVDVLFVSDVMLNHSCYRFTFDDGSTIIADADHLWLTFDAKELAALTRLDPEWRARRRRLRPSKVGGKKSAIFTAAIVERNKANPPSIKLPPSGSIRTSEEIVRTLRTSQGGANHAVPVAGSLDLPDAALPLDPYVLGAWLGDGTTTAGSITTADPEITVAVVAAGFPQGGRQRQEGNAATTSTHYGLQAALRAIGVLGNKHVPKAYLRASRAQRLALLQGLMDTDGTVARNSGCAEFANTNRLLAEAVQHLACSLGHKASLREGVARLGGRVIGPKWTVKWMAPEIVFRLPRKASLQKLATRRTSRFRYITACDPVPSVPVQCIKVSAPDSLYLVGQTLIPTHNTWLALGLAITAHKKTLFLRRESVQLSAAVASLKKLCGPAGSWRSSGNGGVMRYDGRTIELAGCEHEDSKDKFQGRDHDLKVWDELPHFSRSMYQFINGWNRTDDPNQRCRVIATGNPPTRPEDRWVVEEWAPWLDPAFPDPATPGELRWYTYETDANGINQVVWHRTDKAIRNREGQEIKPRSRTFLPARVTDNPVYMATGYMSQLNALPEPLRSQMLFGRFDIGFDDDAWQVIPTAWVKAAQARWTPQPPPDCDFSCLGLDCALGGSDSTAPAARYGRWFARVPTYQGAITDTGEKQADLAMREYRDPDGEAPINVDALGAGAQCLPHLARRVKRVNAINVGDPTNEYDKSGQFRLMNVKAAMWWRMREALDPENGLQLMLPPDRLVLSDLTAPRYLTRGGGIMIEKKEDVKKRTGRSPDVGEAMCLALWDGGGIPVRIVVVDGRGPDPDAPVYASEEEAQKAAQEKINEKANKPLVWGDDMFDFGKGNPW